MPKPVLKFLIMISFFSCDETNPREIIGIYSDGEGTKLELKDNAKYMLEIASTSTTVQGTYKATGDELTLKIEKTDYRPYTIEFLSQEQEKEDGYKFIVIGKDFGILSNVYCTIENDDKILQEGITNEQGIVKFDAVNHGKLVIKHFVWEHIEIDLNKFKNKSVSITLEREKFRENLKKYKFTIDGINLKGIREIDHWKLKKEMM